jgi:hypothetical protein
VVSWLRWLPGRSPPVPPGPERTASKARESAAPGVAAMFDGLSEDGSHSVLDLGSASSASLAVYARFARQVRFSDLTGLALSRTGHEPIQCILDAVPPHPERPYDLIFAWDVFDRLLPEDHHPLVRRLAEVSAPSARLHAVVSGADQGTAPHIRCTLLDTDRVLYEPATTARPALSRLLPAQMAHLLVPFRVVRGFTLKGNLREYVAFREDRR